MNDLEIPGTWVACSLGDVVEYGVTERIEPHEISGDAWILELEDLEKDTSKLLRRVTAAEREPRSTKNRFLAGDVLFGKLRPYLNKVLIADRDGYCTTEIVPLRPPPEVSAKYLYYALKRPIFLEYVIRGSHGLSMPRLGTKAGKAAPFVLAPYNEQKRIVEKLDVVLASVERTRERLTSAREFIRRFKDAVLAAAMSGRLTDDWRRSRGTASGYKDFDVSEDDSFSGYRIPGSWEIASLGSIASIVGGVTKHARKQLPSHVEVPYLRVANVQRGYIDLADVHVLRVPEEKLPEMLLHPGDILFNEGGDIDKLGRGWVWEGQIDPCTFQNHVFRVRLNDAEYAPKFFSLFGNTRAHNFFLQRGKQSTNLASINRGVLAALPVPIPPADEQIEIVSRVDNLLAFVGRAQLRIQSVEERLGRFVQSLLDRTFRGELVHQSPDDEPASELLNRIKLASLASEELGIKQAPSKARTRRMPMLKVDEVREIIRDWPGEALDFDELRARLPADYETLREVIFQLLREDEPVLRQVFDKRSRAIRFNVVNR